MKLKNIDDLRPGKVAGLFDDEGYEVKIKHCYHLW